MATGGTQSNCYLETPNTNVAFFFKQKYASLTLATKITG